MQPWAKCYDYRYYADGRKLRADYLPLYRFMPYRDVDREDSDESREARMV